MKYICLITGLTLFLCSSPSTSVSGEGITLAIDTESPMTFTIVRSSKSRCEPNCPQWISAIGSITNKSPKLLRAVLEKTQADKLPIVLQSPGGELFASLEMGRMIRKAQRGVAVGTTLYEDCPTPGTPCNEALVEKGLYRGLAQDDWSYCFSGCAFLLASGTERLAARGVAVGFHQPYRCNRNRKADKKGSDVCARKTSVANDKRVRGEISKYLEEMGVSQEILLEADKAPPDDINAPGLIRIDELGLVTTRFNVLYFTGVSNCDPPKDEPQCVRREN